jgi:hypothetical protein
VNKSLINNLSDVTSGTYSKKGSRTRPMTDVETRLPDMTEKYLQNPFCLMVYINKTAVRNVQC